MTNIKRISIASIFGFVSGILCYIGALLFGVEVDALRFIFILVNRILIGFVIGISALRMKWALHGVIIGEIVGLPFFINACIYNPNPILLIGILIISPLFGLMIEFFTTIVFKQPLEAS